MTDYPIVYKYENFGFKTKNFLYQSLPKWNPVGMLVVGILIPFKPEEKSWKEVQRELGGKIPNSTELLLGWTGQMREDFDICAEILGYPKLAETPVPVAALTEDFRNLHPMHIADTGAFFHYRDASVGYGWKAVSGTLRLAYRYD